MVIFVFVIMSSWLKTQQTYNKTFTKPHTKEEVKYNDDIKDRRSAVDGESSSWQKDSYIFFLMQQTRK